MCLASEGIRVGVRVGEGRGLAAGATSQAARQEVERERGRGLLEAREEQDCAPGENQMERGYRSGDGQKAERVTIGREEGRCVWKGCGSTLCVWKRAGKPKHRMKDEVGEPEHPQASGTHAEAKKKKIAGFEEEKYAIMNKETETQIHAGVPASVLLAACRTSADGVVCVALFCPCPCSNISLRIVYLRKRAKRAVRQRDRESVADASSVRTTPRVEEGEEERDRGGG